MQIIAVASRPLLLVMMTLVLPLIDVPQASAQAAPQRSDVDVPGFWDPRRRPERPDIGRLTTIRFLTETDYPPFNYAGTDSQPQGFNVDLARLLCAELKLTCTIQMRRFDTLIASLNDNRGDAIIASVAPTSQLRQRVDFSDPYYRTPARFVAKSDSAAGDASPDILGSQTVAVVARSGHEAYLKDLFPDLMLRPYPDANAARAALRRGEVDLLFGDAVSLAFWINGTESGNCCAFRGGPFIDATYFGEGIGIAVKKGNDTLRLALNWALFSLWERGRFADLWLRYFPVSPF